MQTPLHKHALKVLLQHFKVSLSLVAPTPHPTPSVAHGPVRVHVSWVVVHRGPPSFGPHGELRTRPPLCPSRQQSQRAGSQGHWQVQSWIVNILQSTSKRKYKQNLESPGLFFFVVF